MSKHTIVVDTREQSPFDFRDPNVQVVSAKLDTGDYSLRGLTKQITVERKSLADLFGTMQAKNIPRFQRELERMRKFEYRAIVIEASPMGIRAGYSHSMQKGSQILRQIFDLSNWYNIQLLFGASKTGAAELTKIFLLSAAECCRIDEPADFEWQRTKRRMS